MVGRVCLHNPNASSGADIQRTLGLGRKRRQEELAIEDQEVEVVATVR
jgi:hypothetical protein